MDFFDHRFWRDSGLAALIADKYCQVEERNKEDGRIYDQRNGSYGPFLKMSVVPEDIPTEFYDQVTIPSMLLFHFLLSNHTPFFFPSSSFGMLAPRRPIISSL